MGACQGKGYLQEEATMAQISEFIGCVTHGDVTNLRFYLEEKKQDPNAKDVRITPKDVSIYSHVSFITPCSSVLV
jgi:hypothetical protein